MVWTGVVFTCRLFSEKVGRLTCQESRGVAGAGVARAAPTRGLVSLGNAIEEVDDSSLQ